MTELLKDYVRRVRNEKGFSTQKVEELSNREISDGYVSKIENGYIKNVSPEKLKALAKGLGVPEEEIFMVARGASLEPSSFDEAVRAAFLEAENFSPEQKEELLQGVRRFVAGIRAENARRTN